MLASNPAFIHSARPIPAYAIEPW